MLVFKGEETGFYVGDQDKSILMEGNPALVM